ncbi:MAG: hypothetical protein E6G10_23335 [Actinobacteria bacterium]|nr:MAG: hypothetical protein E6G10_23335 [Actinomycetota bacterium]
MSAPHRRRRRGLPRGGLLIAGVLAGAALAAPAGAEVGPGRSLELDQSIELGIVDGYPNGRDVRIDVLRGATLIATKTIPGGGAVDINHVGGGDCWEGVPAGTSPDVKGGDKLVATVLDGAGNPTSDVDFMFVRDIQFDEALPNQITGTAFGVPAGGAFDLAAPMAGDTMDIQRRTDARFNATITVRSDGSFSTPLAGPANQGEVFINHTDGTGGGTAISTSEPGGNGASACGPRVTTALTSTSHSVINAANVVSDMALGGPRLAPAKVTQVTFGGKTYTPVNGADTWSVTIPTADLAALADNSDHSLVVSFSDGSPDETRVIRKDVTAPRVSATVDPGSYPAAQRVALRSDGGEQVRYTLNGSAPRAYDGEPIVLGIGNHAIRATATDTAGNTGVATFTYAIAPALAPPVVDAPAVSPGAIVPRAPSLTVKRLSVLKHLRAGAVRRNGVRLTMSLAAGTRVLELRVYRKVSNRRRLVTRVVRFPRLAGAYAVNLRRPLKPGLYTVVATAGTSQNALDSAHGATATFRVIR